MKKLIILMLFCGMSQVLGSDEIGYDIYNPLGSYQAYKRVASPYTYDEGVNPYRYGISKNRASAEDLAEGTDAMIEGFKSLVTSLWNFMTQ